MISANARVLLEECGIFKLLLNVPTYHLAENIPQKILKILTKIIQSTNIIHVKYNTTLSQIVFIFQVKIIQEKVNKCVFPKNKIF